jgi:hypothetical protein
MNWYETDNNRLIIADVITKVWQDPQYGEALVAEPKKVLQEAGIDNIPEEIELKTIRNSSERKYFVLPEKFTVDEVSKLTTSMQSLLPLSSGQEMVFVQNTENLQHFALPIVPDSEISSLSLEELESVSGAAAVFVASDVVIGAEVAVVVLAVAAEVVVV